MAVVEVPGIGNVHFPEGMSNAEMSQAVQGLLAQQKAGGGQLPAQGTLPSAAPAQAATAPAAPAAQPITAGQQLREDYNPITTGLGTMGNDIMTGAGEAVAGDGMLAKIMGLAKVINAPAAGAGSAVGTTAQNILGNIPGLGGPGGVIPSGGAALADAATQLLAGPGILKGASRGLKATGQIIPRILAPGHLRSAGAEAMAMELGMPATTLERVFSTPASKAAYKLAESQGAAPTATMRDIVEQAFMTHGNMSNPSSGALNYLSKLEKKFAEYKQLPYGDVMKEIQALKSKADAAFSGARPDNLLGQTLRETRELLIQQLDKISPIYRRANQLYRQEQATIDIMNAVRAGTPGVNLEKLIENSPDVAKAFSQPVVKEITHIAKELNDVASATPAGGFRQAIASMAKPVTDMLTTELGRKMLRASLRSPGNHAAKAEALSAVVATYKAMTPKQTE